LTRALAIIAGRCAEGLRTEKNSFKRPFPDWRNGIVAVTAGEIFRERRPPAVSHDDCHVQQPRRRQTRLWDESIGGRRSISHDACWTVYQPRGCRTRDLLTSKCQRTADLTRTSSTSVGAATWRNINTRVPVRDNRQARERAFRRASTDRKRQPAGLLTTSTAFFRVSYVILDRYTEAVCIDNVLGRPVNRWCQHCRVPLSVTLTAKFTPQLRAASLRI